MKMCTTQLQRCKIKEVSQLDKTWCSVFPSEVNTAETSLIFVKKLVAIGVSTITYLRMIFPEASYKDKSVEGHNLKILMDESPCPGANMLTSWMKGCFDAIEKKYLREMILAIYTDADDYESVLETYTYKFSYSDDGEVILSQLNGSASNEKGVCHKYEVKKPTVKMIRTLILLMQSLDHLPEKVFLRMKIHYYENITPQDYEPPGFCAAHDDDYKYPKHSVCLKVGDVTTAFHSIKLRASVDSSRFSVEEGDAATSQESNAIHDDRSNSIILSQDSGTNNIFDNGIGKLERSIKIRQRSPGIGMTENHRGCNDDLGNSIATISSSITPDMKEVKDNINSDSQRVPRSPLSSDNSVKSDSMNETPIATPKLTDIFSNPSSSCSMRSISVDLAPTQNKEYPVRCPCGINMDDGLMILCDVCSYWQHAACFTIIEETRAPGKHICELCADPPTLCTDPRLCWADRAQVEGTCLYRRALVVVRTLRGRISSAIIAHKLGVDISIGTRVIEKMTQDAVLRKARNGISREIDMDVLLKVAYPKYFNKTLEGVPDVEDRRASSDTEKLVECVPNEETCMEEDDLLFDSQMSVDVVNNTPSVICKGNSPFTDGSLRENTYCSVYPKKDSEEQNKELGFTFHLKEKENERPSVNDPGKGLKLSRGKRKISTFQGDVNFEINSSPISNTWDGNKPKKKKKTSGTPGIRV